MYIHGRTVKAEPILTGYIPALFTKGKNGYGLSAVLGSIAGASVRLVLSAKDAN